MLLELEALDADELLLATPLEPLLADDEAEVPDEAPLAESVTDEDASAAPASSLRSLALV